MMKCKMMEWEEAHYMIKQLYEKIKAKKYRPDAIIAIARGGYNPARELCDYLGVKELESVNVDHWDVPATKNGKIEITKKVGLSLKNKKVLIVDDISDTGESLKIATEYVKKLGPASIKTATMQIRHISEFVPDFYVKEFKDQTWIIHPWMVHEDLSEFILEVTDDWKTSSQISRELHENRGLKLEKEKIEETLEDMKYWEKVENKKDQGKEYWKKV